MITRWLFAVGSSFLIPASFGGTFKGWKSDETVDTGLKPIRQRPVNTFARALQVCILCNLRNSIGAKKSKQLCYEKKSSAVSDAQVPNVSKSTF